MTLQDAQHEDVFLVLTITPEEAQYGGIHTFILPNGRSVLVTIPANTRAHDEIRLSGQDLSTNDYPISKDLVLQIALSSTTESVTPADTTSSAEETLLLATSQAGEFPLILPATPASFEQSAFQQDSLTSSESTALYDASPASPPVNFQALPLTPVDLVAIPLTPVPDEATISASLLSADLALAPLISDEATISISEPPADHVPAATPAQAEVPAAPASSEIVVMDEVDPSTVLAPDAPASSAASEIIVLDDAAPASPPAFPTAEPYIFTGPPQILPFQPKRRKRPDRTAILSLCTAFLLLILSAGGLIFDLAYYQPYQIHSSATATTSAAPTVTAHAEQTQIAYSEQTSTAQQKATATAYQDIYTQATSGRPFLNDSLKHQTNSAWDEGQLSDNSSCAFKHASYEVSIPKAGYFMPCFAESSFFTNFAIQVNLHIVTGDAGGIFFRGDSYYADGYLFEIYQDGDYSLYAYTGSNANQTILSSTTGFYQFGQVNQLTIIARGTTYYIYLNQHFLQSTTDKTFGEGMIGLVADDSQNATTVDFTNFKVWWLP